MKKAILIILAIALLVSVALGVNAHPGRTDGKGGHTNRSTGEYHYHHGYSEHDHYDMDGDGQKDCPYDFRDKTDRNSGSGSSIAGIFSAELVITIVAAVIFIGLWIMPAFFKKK